MADLSISREVAITRKIELVIGHDIYWHLLNTLRGPVYVHDNSEGPSVTVRRAVTHETSLLAYAFWSTLS